MILCWWWWWLLLLMIPLLIVWYHCYLLIVMSDDDITMIHYDTLLTVIPDTLVDDTVVLPFGIVVVALRYCCCCVVVTLCCSTLLVVDVNVDIGIVVVPFDDTLPALLLLLPLPCSCLPCWCLQWCPDVAVIVDPWCHCIAIAIVDVTGGVTLLNADGRWWWYLLLVMPLPCLPCCIVTLLWWWWWWRIFPCLPLFWVIAGTLCLVSTLLVGTHCWWPWQCDAIVSDVDTLPAGKIVITCLPCDALFIWWCIVGGKIGILDDAVQWWWVNLPAMNLCSATPACITVFCSVVMTLVEEWWWLLCFVRYLHTQFIMPYMPIPQIAVCLPAHYTEEQWWALLLIRWCLVCQWWVTIDLVHCSVWWCIRWYCVIPTLQFVITQLCLHAIDTCHH